MDPVLKRFRLEDPTTVTLKVGPEKKTFYPHKDLLCKASPFFEATLQGNFKEASDNVVELSDDSMQVLEDFLKWMYSGDAGHPDLSLLLPEDLARTEYERSIQLYGFAEKVDCVGLKRRLLTNFFVVFIAFDDPGRIFWPRVECVRLAYDLTPHESALRRLLVASTVYKVRKTWWEHENVVSDLAAVPEYAAELAVAFAMVENRSNPFKTGTARSFYDQDMLEMEVTPENSKETERKLKAQKAPKRPASTPNSK